MFYLKDFNSSFYLWLWFWTWSWANRCRWPALSSRGIGADDLWRSLPASAILWPPPQWQLQKTNTKTNTRFGFDILKGLKSMQEQNWWTVFLFPPWWCVLLHSRDTGWMKWESFAPRNILILCTIQDLLLKEQGKAFCTLQLWLRQSKISQFCNSLYNWSIVCGHSTTCDNTFKGCSIRCM